MDKNISKYIMDKYSNCGKYMSEKVPDANLIGVKTTAHLRLFWGGEF